MLNNLYVGQGSEQVTGHAALIGVAKELGVEVLISCQGEVLTLSDLVKCFVKNSNIRIGHAADTVIAELLNSNRAITLYEIRIRIKR